MIVKTPEVGEFVIVTVKRILPYGAICALDEYNGLEAFVHVSEVSAGWVRNIREHLKEGQKTVGRVARIDFDKRQIDLSFKRVTEGDKRRKLDSFKAEKKAQKTLERIAAKISAKAELKRVSDLLLQSYGDLQSVFADLSAGEELKAQLPPAWKQALIDVSKEEKPRELKVRMELTLKSTASDGIIRVKAVLAKLSQLASEVHYISAPNYILDFTGTDAKVLEKKVKQAETVLEEAQKKAGVEFTLQKEKQK
jgi:translation initiation factor 2 subunit 1